MKSYNLGLFIISILCLILGAANVYAASCCKVTYSWIEMGPDGVCSGEIVAYCEEGSPNTLPGNLSGTIRLAKCYVVLADEFYRGSCTNSPGALWTRLPGTLADGSCCWAKNADIDSYNRTFSISPCDGAACNAQPPEVPS